MKWPWILRSKHSRILKSVCRDHTNEIERIRSGLVRILNKFAKVSLSCLHSDPHTWRVVFDLDPRPIVFSLERGDDDLMIEYIAEELKYKIIRELKSMNIQRLANLGLER